MFRPGLDTPPDRHAAPVPVDLVEHRVEGVDTFTALRLVANRQIMDLLEWLGAVRVVERAAELVEVEVHLPAIGVSPELRKLIRLAAASDIAIPIGQLPRGQRTRPGSG